MPTVEEIAEEFARNKCQSYTDLSDEYREELILGWKDLLLTFYRVAIAPLEKEHEIVSKMLDRADERQLSSED